MSVPSWWGVAVLEEVTCWVRLDMLAGVLRRVQSSPPRPGPDLWRAVVEEKLLQDCRSRPSVVRLPGGVTEISARLGIDVVKRPHIRSSPLEIAAGEPSHTLMVSESYNRGGQALAQHLGHGWCAAGGQDLRSAKHARDYRRVPLSRAAAARAPAE